MVSFFINQMNTFLGITGFIVGEYSSIISD